MDQKIYEICNRMETDFSLYKDRGISALDKRRLKKVLRLNCFEIRKTKFQEEGYSVYRKCSRIFPGSPR